jgi:hypothetical protein
MRLFRTYPVNAHETASRAIRAGPMDFLAQQDEKRSSQMTPSSQRKSEGKRARMDRFFDCFALQDCLQGRQLRKHGATHPTHKKVYARLSRKGRLDRAVAAYRSPFNHRCPQTTLLSFVFLRVLGVLCGEK